MCRRGGFSGVVHDLGFLDIGESIRQCQSHLRVDGVHKPSPRPLGWVSYFRPRANRIRTVEVRIIGEIHATIGLRSRARTGGLGREPAGGMCLNYVF